MLGPHPDRGPTPNRDGGCTVGVGLLQTIQPRGLRENAARKIVYNFFLAASLVGLSTRPAGQSSLVPEPR